MWRHDQRDGLEDDHFRFLPRGRGGKTPLRPPAREGDCAGPTWGIRVSNESDRR